VNTSSLAPIQVPQGTSPPVATSNVSLAAELPATPSSQPVSTQVNVYDSLGTMHQLDLSFTQKASNDWTVAISSDGSSTPIGTAELKFGNASSPQVAAGTIGSITPLSGSGVTASSSSGTNSPATLSFNADFGNGSQPITLNLGNYGGTSGLTQFSGSSFNLIGASQNGVAQGNFSNLAIDTHGNVSVNYTNGATQTVAQVPIATFRAPDALQNQSGEAYTASQGSGTATINAVGSGSAGSLVTGSTEGSNVDIATEFTKLITAQQAYSANAKVITTANQLSQTTLNILP